MCPDEPTKKIPPIEWQQGAKDLQGCLDNAAKASMGCSMFGCGAFMLLWFIAPAAALKILALFL